MKSATPTPALETATAALAALDAAAARLIRRQATTYNILPSGERVPSLAVRTVDGIVYGAWCEVPSKATWSGATFGLGCPADVAAYKVARAELDAALAALAAAAKAA